MTKIDAAESDAFKIAFRAALIYTLGRTKPFVSARIQEKDLTKAIATAERELSADEVALRNAKADLRELRRALDAERQRSDDLVDELEDSDKRLSTWKARVDDAFDEKDDLKERLNYEIDQARETSAFMFTPCFYLST